MMQNPMPEERMEKLKDDAKEFLEEFSLSYLRNFGMSMFDEVRKELEDKPAESKFRLKHREFSAVPRTDFFSGFVFVQSGQGAGDFGDWKKVYVAEREDYGIDVYNSDSDFQKGKKPKFTIQTAGYKLVTDCRQHYTEQFSAIAKGLSMPDDEAHAFTASISRSSWALAHPQRLNYIFNMEKGSGGGCMCFGGSSTVEPEPDETEKGNSEEKQALIDFMQACAAKADPRDKSTIPGKAFEATCLELPSKVEDLANWTDNGTESEMIVDMLMEVCLSELRDAILQDLTGPTVMRVKVWYKTLKLIYTTLSKLMEVAWDLMQKGIEAIREKIDPTIRQGMAKIITLKMTVEQKVKALVIDKLGEVLGKYVTPFIQPFLAAFEKPLANGFKAGRVLLQEQVKLSELSGDAKARNAALDKVSRDRTNRKLLSDPLSELSETLEKLISMNEMTQKVFAGLQVDKLKTSAEDALLEIVDAAIYTLETRLEAGQSSATLLDEVLQDYDYDAIIARSTYVKEIVWTVFSAAFMNLVSPHTDPILQTVSNAIPEEMSSFLDVKKIFQDLVNTFVGQPISQMVEKAYPLPK